MARPLEWAALEASEKEVGMEKEFALVLAGQVSTGLLEGDDELARARAALITIGMMVLNASDRDEDVRAQLEIVGNAVVTVDGGTTTVTYTPPE